MRLEDWLGGVQEGKLRPVSLARVRGRHLNVLQNIGTCVSIELLK